MDGSLSEAVRRTSSRSTRRTTVCLPALFAALLLTGCATGSAAPKPPAAGPATARSGGPGRAYQVNTDVRGGRQPTTDAVVLARLEETAREIPAHAQAARIALADVAYPATQDELDALGGYAVILVTAVSHESRELPIDRVEVRSGAGVAKLIEVGSRKSLLADARLAEVFGQFRHDAIYLIPVSATQMSSKVTVFVGGGVYPLAVLTFPVPLGEETLPPGLVFKGDVRAPKPDALRAMVEREFPLVTAHGGGEN